MIATVYEILEKTRQYMFDLAMPGDFVLRESGKMDAAEILHNDTITLYCYDLEGQRALFVQTPPEVDLCRAPFYYIAQAEHAQRVITVPFADLPALASASPLDDERLTFIYSTGRAGSTLAGQVFGALDGVANLSEPDVLTQMVITRSLRLASEQQLRILLDAAVRLLCKQDVRAWTVKGRSFVIELGDWLHELYPAAAALFLYRDGRSYHHSALYAFGDDKERSDEEFLAMEQTFRQDFSPLVPLMAASDPAQRMNFATAAALVWLSAMERYEQLARQGVQSLAIPFRFWKERPRETAVAMLEYAGLRPEDLAAVEAALARDSQAGTAVAQEETHHRHIDPRFLDDPEALDRVLRAHPFIHAADFVAANTLAL